jgi:hypothetical protein
MVVDEREVRIGSGCSSPKLALEKTSAQRASMIEQGFIPMRSDI